MSIKIDRNTKFEVIKDWFVSAIKAKELPDTLWNGYCFYNDVSAIALRMIELIEIHLELYGGGEMKRSAVADSEQNNLVNLYKDLQDKSKWNIERPEKLKFIDKWAELSNENLKNKAAKKSKK